MTEPKFEAASALAARDAEPHKIEVIDSMEPFVGDQLSLLGDPNKNWQPFDFLPDFAAEDWREKLRELRESAAALTDELLIVLVGDMVTEEALPSYQTMLNRYEGIGDPTGDAPSAWAKWSRGWTSEENRHGDLLNKFLFLTGRVDMRSIERTIQNLLTNGFNGLTGSDPYKGFIYTSFQERATKISHANVAKLVRDQGSKILGSICSVIAADEARHEEAYKRFMGRIFEIDPKGAIISFRDMMKTTITMPARHMDDGEERAGNGSLFDQFSSVAQRLGVYTARDYTTIIEHLVERWNVSNLTGLFGEAAAAQDYLCGLADRYRKLAERIESRMTRQAPVKFSWVFNRSV